MLLYLYFIKLTLFTYLKFALVMENSIVYKVEKNEFYGDYRVVKYINGVWENEFDGNWSKHKAAKKCAALNKAALSNIN